MATIRMRRNKDGYRVYDIRVQINDERFCITWPLNLGEIVPITWSDKRARSEAKKYAVIYEAECKKGLISNDKRTLIEYARYVIDFKEKTGVLKPTTIDGYNDLMPRIEESGLGKMRLRDIGARNLNAFYAWLAEDGRNNRTGGKLSSKTIREYHSFVQSVLQQAAREGIIPFNPAKNSTPPKVEKKEADCYPPELIERILDIVQKEAIHWKAMTYFLVGTGARRGEAAGLKWDDIDFDNNRVRIQRNVTRKERGGGLVVGSVKTGFERTISVAPEVLSVMREWRMLQAGLLGGISLRGYCFSLSDPEVPMDPDSITNYYSRLGKRYGLGNIHPHGFRHSQASVILQDGDVVMASKRLGHSKTSTTLDIYGHMMPTTDDAASEKVRNTFFKKVK